MFAHIMQCLSEPHHSCLLLFLPWFWPLLMLDILKEGYSSLPSWTTTIDEALALICLDLQCGQDRLSFISFVSMTFSHLPQRIQTSLQL